MMKTYEMLICEKNQGIAKLILNSPETRNALSRLMQGELIEALEDIAQDNNVRAVVITGTGKSFCAGGDIKNMVGQNGVFLNREFLMKHHQWLSLIVEMEKPVISAVNGFAIGAGLSMAMAGDIILASESAKFGLAFVKLGLVPDLGGLFFLPRLIGLAKAKELTFTGDVFSAQDAERLGLINHVVPDEKLQEIALEFALRLANGPTKGIGLAKKLLNRSFETDFHSMLELESFVQTSLKESDDFHEGTRAFLEKRSPLFQGK